MPSLKFSRVVLLAIALIFLAGILIGFILYNKPHRSVENEDAIAVTAIQMFKEFEQNETRANERYLNKAILVSGTIAEVNANQEGKTIVILETDNPMFGVSCTIENKIENLESGSSITIKGICTGYLSDVVITRGIIQNK